MKNVRGTNKKTLLTSGKSVELWSAAKGHNSGSSDDHLSSYHS